MARKSFDDESIKRIVRSVLQTERQLQNPVLSSPSFANDATWWPFRNDYAGEVPAFGVIEITGMTVPSGQGFGIYTATRPSTTLRRYAVNSARPAPQGGSGQCCFVGPCQVAYASGTPAANEGWGVVPNSFLLAKNYPSLVQVDGIIDSSKKWLRGFVGPITTLYGKATSSITARSTTTPGSGPFEIWYNNAGTLTDAGFSDITIKNLSSTAGTSGNYMGVTFTEGEWWLTFEDCS